MYRSRSSSTGERWDRVRRWRCSAPTGTPDGSWWRSCASAGSCRCCSAATRAGCAALAACPGLDARPASVDDPASLDRALAGAAAVINCAGPFASTAAPVIEAALRAGIPYVDVAAEIEANVDTFAHFSERARAAGIAVVPAMAFFGGLGDLLVTAAMGDWTAADEAHVAYGLSSWHPTAGTLAAGRGLPASAATAAGSATPAAGWSTTSTSAPADPGVARSRRRWARGRVHRRVHDGRRRHRPQPPGHPRGAHLHDRRRRHGPVAAGHAGAGRGRRARPLRADLRRRRRGASRRRANAASSATGQDIYAVSAPLAVEAVRRILAGQTRTSGVASAGEIFDAPDFLRALSPSVSVDRHPDENRPELVTQNA